MLSRKRSPLLAVLTAVITVVPVAGARAAPLSVDRAGTFSKSGTATVSGTASCAAGSSGFVGGNLTQSVGRVATITGSGFELTGVVCDGTPRPWSFVVTPTGGLFRGGRADASVVMLACAVTFICQVDQVTQTIRLNGG